MGITADPGGEGIQPLVDPGPRGTGRERLRRMFVSIFRFRLRRHGDRPAYRIDVDVSRSDHLGNR